MKKLHLKNEKGSLIVGAMITIIVLVSYSIALASLVITLSIKTQRSYQVISALSLAEAGVEKTMWELNSNRAISCTSLCTLETGQFEVSVVDTSGESKEITATSYIPSKANYKIKRIVIFSTIASPSSQGVAFNYAIQAGAGGIVVGGSSEVEGNLYSNGNVSVSNPARVKKPGNVWAVGTISDPSNRIDGTKTEGAVAKPLPDLDINLWRTLAKNGGTITGDYSPNGSGNFTDLGPKEITGNMSMSNSNQKINLFGPLYIHGDLTISGGEWKIDDSLGTKGTVVLVDGKINISGSAKFTKNSYSTYILFVSTNAANTSSNPAINFTGSADAKNAAFYATIGAMKFSGSGEIIAMTGETLFIEGSGELEYKSGLASAEFSGGPGGIWIKDKWQEKTK